MKYVLDKPEKAFFISDIHWSHSNIQKYCNRPDNWEDLVYKNWNEKVKNDDIIFILGDYSFSEKYAYRDKNVYDLTKELKGNKILVIGNHDSKLIRKEKFRSLFTLCVDYLEIKIPLEKDFIVCSHYPMLSWNHSRHNSIHLHGHCHGDMNHKNIGLFRLDVGIDANRETFNHSQDKFGTPVNYYEIKKYFEEQKPISTDHHEKN